MQLRHVDVTRHQVEVELAAAKTAPSAHFAGSTQVEQKIGEDDVRRLAFDLARQLRDRKLVRVQSARLRIHDAQRAMHTLAVCRPIGSELNLELCARRGGTKIVRIDIARFETQVLNGAASEWRQN